MKQFILRWCVKLVSNNLRCLDARQLCQLKHRLKDLNCTSKQFDRPNVRKVRVIS